MKDLYNNVDFPAVTIDPVIATNSSVPAAVEVDLADCNSAVLFFQLGTPATSLSGSNYLTFALSHADDDGTGSSDSYTDCVTADVQGATIAATGIVVTVDADAEADMTYKIGYIGGKRFIKVTTAETGTLPNLPIAVVTVKGDLLDAPPIA